MAWPPVVGRDTIIPREPMASRRKRRASRALDASVKSEPEPLPTWSEVVRRPAFRAAAARQALPLLGVLLLHWSALDIVAFFLFEVWLFLTLRIAFERTFDQPGAAELPAGRLVKELLGYALMGGFAIAFMVAMVVVVAVV